MQLNSSATCVDGMQVAEASGPTREVVGEHRAAEPRGVGEEPVSYTHLDVYKRQLTLCSRGNEATPCTSPKAPKGAEEDIAN